MPQAERTAEGANQGSTLYTATAASFALGGWLCLESGMTPEQRAALEKRALRSLRRGDLGDALTALKAVAEAFPADPGLLERVRQIEGELQPEELAQVRSASPEPQAEYATPAQRAEALASRGDFAAAIAIYRSLAQAEPRSELIGERLAELFQLAQAATHKPALARIQLFEHLLDRIGSRRRSE
jgi:hypothetical protein